MRDKGQGTRETIEIKKKLELGMNTFYKRITYVNIFLTQINSTQTLILPNFFILTPKDTFFPINLYVFHPYILKKKSPVKRHSHTGNIYLSSSLGVSHTTQT